MNRFVHRMLGHYLLDEAEEGQDLAGAVDEQQEAEEPAEEAEAEEEPVEEAEEVIISFEQERLNAPDEEAQKAPQWVKDLRKRVKDQEKELRELRSQASKVEAKPAIEVGAKPTLSDCDYDEEVFDQKLTAWYDRKRQADQQVESQRKEQEEAEADWQKDLSSYNEKKAALKLPDFEEAEAALINVLDENRLAMIVKAADNPALVMYALGKSQQQAKTLAAIKDPVKFIAAVARLEGKVSMEKKTKPAPERTVSGTAPKSGAVDNNLERLRAEAEKTGDMSKVMEYRRQQRMKA